MKSLLRTRQAQAVLASLMSVYLSVALRSTRWTLHGQAHLAAHAIGSPAVFAFWHEYLPMMPMLAVMARKLPGYRPVVIHTLVSHHRDGRFIGTAVRRFGIRPIFGSSSRGGAAGLRAVLGVLARGEPIGITPDGPRGPRRQAAGGVAQIAAAARVPVVPCAARTTRHIKLRSWDGMTIPLPFGRGVMVCGPPIPVPRERWREVLPTVAAGLNAAAARADASCPR